MGTQNEGTAPEAVGGAVYRDRRQVGRLVRVVDTGSTRYGQEGHIMSFSLVNSTVSRRYTNPLVNVGFEAEKVETLAASGLQLVRKAGGGAAPESEREDAGTVSDVTEVSVSHWDRCPVKSRMIPGRGYMFVEFDGQCPRAISCHAVTSLPKAQVPLSVTDRFYWPQGWTLEQVRQYNEALAKRLPEAAMTYVPVVAVGSACGGCTRGSSKAINGNQPRRVRRPQVTGVSLQEQAQQAGAEAADQVRTGRKVSRRRKGNN